MRVGRSSFTALSDEPICSDWSWLMLNQGEMVTYKEFSRKLAGLCGIVEGIVRDQPDYVWVRWVGETSTKKENISELEVL
jgi:hypothetical protein